MSYFEQAANVEHTYDRWVASHEEPNRMIKTQYLYLSAFTCTECNSRLVAAIVVTREGDDQRETGKRRLGLGCRSCGTQYDPRVPSRAVRHIVPLQWGSVDLVNEKTSVIQVAA